MAFDMRGHGDSTTPAGGYRVSRLAADLRAVIERLELDQVDLMGHSIGSSIIWSYIDLFGEDRLGRLVFVDQAPSVTAKPDWSAADRVTYGCLLPDLEALAEFYLQVLAAETAEATVPVIARLFSPSLPAAELLWFAREICKLPRRHAADLLYDHCGLDWRDVIKRVRRPTLVVGAEASIFSRNRSAGSRRRSPVPRSRSSRPARAARISCATRIRLNSTHWWRPSSPEARPFSPRCIPLARYPAYGGSLGTGCRPRRRSSRQCSRVAALRYASLQAWIDRYLCSNVRADQSRSKRHRLNIQLLRGIA